MKQVLGVAKGLRKKPRWWLAAAGFVAISGTPACRTVPDPGETLPAAEMLAEEPEEVVRVSPTRPKPPRAIANRYREVAVDGPFIAMTFDDGPNARQTPALLDILKERDIQATFFVVGRSAAAHPEILRRMVAEGHEIGNHSWNHASLDKLTVAKTDWQIRSANTAIESAIGEMPTVMRPPYGATDRDLNHWVTETFGMRVILWSVDSRDWKHRDENSIRTAILSATKPGAIILAHDTHATTVAAMPRVLDDLEEAGFRFVTVSELIAMETSGDGN